MGRYVSHLTRQLSQLTLAIVLTACASAPEPENLAGAIWMPQQGSLTTHQQACLPETEAPAFPQANFVPMALMQAEKAHLAPGDRVRIAVIGDDETLSGTYIVDNLGELALPGLPAIDTKGKTRDEARQQLRGLLIDQGLVRDLPRVVDISLLESAGVSIPVTGAVFNPGTVRVGERAVEARVGQIEGNAGGDANTERSLSAALRAASGVRPDAAIDAILLVRGERWTQVDMSGLLDGTRFTDIHLSPGDRITVPSTGCFDPRLVRPSALTPPGVRVYMSNLSRPAASNSNAAINKDATSLPYGTRLLQALVSANCVGGAAMNARRQAILISTNPVNQTSVVIKRDIEGMLTNARRDSINPYLMPDDAIACYDSRTMNFRDAISLFGEALGTAATVILIDDVAK
ncbi:polysaccharide biosynthesis/export family protein [Modicisalibacter radicis]|uniref:polysaccharide biosynthesis/export family protein n=1 Tax=Halomonas sp. EAR18 TaxID=2518972 RepID=UPI00109C4494|nr:polysaccharide biosynthesis/export family protein [Halomonas sp. EAR18]